MPVIKYPPFDLLPIKTGGLKTSRTSSWGNNVDRQDRGITCSTETKARCPDCPTRPGFYVGLLDVLPCEGCSGTGYIQADAAEVIEVEGRSLCSWKRSTWHEEKLIYTDELPKMGMMAWNGVWVWYVRSETELRLDGGTILRIV